MDQIIDLADLNFGHHLPLVMALQVAVSDAAWPWPIKYAVVVGGAFVVLLGSYQLLVRNSFIGCWLNGRRYPAKPRGVSQT